MLLSTIILYLFCYCCFYQQIFAENSDLYSHTLATNTLFLRQNILKVFSQKKNHGSCSTDKYVQITEYAFGRNGNNMIEFAHGLFVSEYLNSTLIVPEWMNEIFHNFDLDHIHSQFCFVHEVPKATNITIFPITSEESFFLFKLKTNAQLHSLFLHEETLISKLSLHFINVYSSFWCCPHKRLLYLSNIYLNHQFPNMIYSAVHKRKLEGGCSKIFAQSTTPRDFSSLQIPLNHSVWNQNLAKFHPLCEMTYEFVNEIIKINFQESKIFVAFDGKGEISDYVNHHAFFLKDFDFSKYNDGQHLNHKELAFLDIFISIHSSFFILNPRSTFSWQIFVIRSILSLSSLPTIETNDIYLQKIPDDLISANRSLWVSWYSILKVLKYF